MREGMFFVVGLFLHRLITRVIAMIPKWIVVGEMELRLDPIDDLEGNPRTIKYLFYLRGNVFRTQLSEAKKFWTRRGALNAAAEYRLIEDSKFDILNIMAIRVKG